MFATSDTAPVYRASGINGQPAVEFGADKKLVANDVDVNLVNDFTAFLVKNDDEMTASNPLYVEFEASGASLPTLHLYRNRNGHEKFIVKASGNWTTDYINYAGLDIVQGQTYQTTYVRSGENLSLYRDGVHLKTDSSGSAGPLEPYDTQTGKVEPLNLILNEGGHLNGRISKFLFYNRVLTDAERTAVRAYLANSSPTGSVTITGTASEGQTLTVSNSLTDADGLTRPTVFEDSFSGSDLGSHWSFHDDPLVTNDAGHAWAFNSAYESIIQTSNAWGSISGGEGALWGTVAYVNNVSLNHNAVDVQTKVFSKDNDDVGIVARYASDTSSYYRFTVRKQKDKAYLIRVDNANTAVLLKSVPATYTPHEWFDLRFVVEWNQLSGYKDGVLLLTATDNAAGGPLTGGTAGLVTRGE